MGTGQTNEATNFQGFWPKCFSSTKVHENDQYFTPGLLKLTKQVLQILFILHSDICKIVTLKLNWQRQSTIQITTVFDTVGSVVVQGTQT